MPRKKPTPPPQTPSFPLLTLDSLVALLLRPITNPFFTILPPLAALAVNPDTSNKYFQYQVVFSVICIIIQLFIALNKKVAGGSRRSLDWEQEVVLITGGAGGLGRVLAEFYGSIRRCTTIVVDVAPASEERIREWEEVGCTYCQCDVSSYDAVMALKRQVEDEAGRVSILILAAGIANAKSILDLSEVDVKRSVGVNLMGAVWCVKAFLPAMVGRNSPEEDSKVAIEDEEAPGGTIVTVSSVLGYLGAAGLADYTATKAALTAFHTSLKAELENLHSESPAKEPQPRVNTILATPGQLSTPLFQHIPPPPLASFVGPTVTPAALATEIIKAVDEGKDAEINLPLYAGWVGFLRIMPSGLGKVLRKAVGVDWAGWQGTKALQAKR